MPNPHGNPEIKKYGFKTDRKESLSAKLTLRIPQSMLDKIKAIDNYPDFCRQALQKALDELDQLDSQDE
ncbi:hypothetical protein [Fischerella sp. PCC 9605]|uniref:hypothetical protein n=1 Tax=Fischerella sp. PCC 9605 TaxID=1173024 RepID=UPI00047B69B8|nr:hypothetical protein [Fischerella sp. PCC 9605]